MNTAAGLDILSIPVRIRCSGRSSAAPKASRADHDARTSRLRGG